MIVTMISIMGNLEDFHNRLNKGANGNSQPWDIHMMSYRGHCRPEHIDSQIKKYCSYWWESGWRYSESPNHLGDGWIRKDDTKDEWMRSILGKFR